VFLDEEMTNKIKALTKEIYGILGMRGIVRMDYILNKDEVPFLIEINSVPGMSRESIIPQMAIVDSIELSTLF
jgi:D-alanine-D-alanine ligase